DERTGLRDVDVTTDVQAFLNGAVPNYGWRIAGIDSTSGGLPPSSLVLDVEPPPIERGVIRVAADHWNFEWSGTGQPFVPRGVNYFGPFSDALLEDHWDDRWPLIERDLRKISADGLNAVRIHLQLGRYMPSSPSFDEHALLKLDQLVGLAHHLGLVV